MKKAILILVLFVSFLNTKAFAEDTINLGGANISLSFCRQVSKIAAVLNASQIQQWPVVGAGFAIGFIQTDNPVKQVCDYIINLEGLSVSEAAFFTLDKLNQVTNSKWNQNLKFAKKTWRVASSAYDFSRGKSKTADMTAEAMAADVGDWALEARKTFRYKETVGVSGGRDFADEMKMNDLQKSARERAFIESRVNCPDGSSEEKGIETEADVYTAAKSDYQFYQDDMEFLRAKLIDLGPKFIGNMSSYKEYVRGLDEVTNQAYQMKPTMSSYEVGNSTSKTGKVTEDDTTGDVTAETKKVKLTRKYQLWTVDSSDSSKVDTYISSWRSDYRRWVKQYFDYYQDTGTDDKSVYESSNKSVTNDYMRDFASKMDYECSNSRVQKSIGVKKTDPKYSTKLSEALVSCREQFMATMTIKKVYIIFETITQQMADSLKKMKEARAKMWTLESKYLGRFRNVAAVADESKGETMKTERVTCDSTLEAADQTMLILRSQMLATDYQEKMNKELAMMNQMNLDQKKAEQEEARELSIKAKIEEDRRKSESDSMRAITPIPLSNSANTPFNK